MPLVKYFNNKLIRSTKRLSRNGKIMIRITFEAAKGVQGEQIIVTEDEFNKGRSTQFQQTKKL